MTLIRLFPSGKYLPLIALLLSACVSQPLPRSPGKSPDSVQWKQHQSQASQVQRFQTLGAFAYLSDNQKIYARFNWQQQSSDHYRLLLTNPLGSTELQLDQQGHTVQLVDNKGQRYFSHNAEQMVSRLTGMHIPLETLRQWMLGLPGQAERFTLNDHYLLHTADYRQQGVDWHLVINDYRTDMTPVLPASLELTAQGQRIKLRMDSWTTK